MVRDWCPLGPKIREKKGELEVHGEALMVEVSQVRFGWVERGGLVTACLIKNFFLDFGATLKCLVLFL
jgi:hypothetical protein